MGHQPARRFRNPRAHHQDSEPQHRADEERRAPAVIRGQECRVEQDDGPAGAERRPDPEAAVDDEVGMAAIARRHELLNGRGDGRVFAADARACQEAEQGEAHEVPREGRRRRGHEIDGERDEEEPFAPEAVGEPAEQQRTQHRPGEIEARGEPDLGVGQLEHGAFFQRAGDRPGQRHLQPVQHPGDAERHDHERVEASPAQTVEARRHRRLHHLVPGSRHPLPPSGRGRMGKLK